MLGLVIAAIGAGLKLAAPLIVPALMGKLERKLPNKGDGPKRRQAVMNLYSKFADSLVNDGFLTKPETRELLEYVGNVIETFVPAMNYRREVENGEPAAVLDLGGVELRRTPESVDLHIRMAK